MAEHRKFGEIEFHLVNISPNGFMIVDPPDLDRGERVQLRLPVIGRIEGHLVWSHERRSGFQFERIIRPDDFALLLSKLEAESGPLG